ncbi:PIG-L deacetylase family protein [Pseudomonas sp. PDM11]|uniref:PIG-L deacetylase family protein n=1 Tax=Pseudomonas sp. PDM11 TaxID=2769309 RepID=UPI0017807CE8|nr:PIG-L family deacetylase [Pseudomonas sp. PDM11]MBD9398829.1 PIG-L family deacetylase [Pseudomonas sp. PDM11]
MNGRKQLLLKQHRRNKRIALVLAFLILLALGVLVAWWLPPMLLLLGWVAHEAWFADHLFYSPRDDYHYDFPNDCLNLPARIEHGVLQVEVDLDGGYETLVLELRLVATWLGRWLDPHVLLGGDRQDFERGVSGRRYLNLSGQRVQGLSIVPRFCRIHGELRLHAMCNPDFATQRMLIVAPHADDAELAAFGQYSRSSTAAIVTLTQGEIEAENYERLGLDKAAAASLKGRLRAWDSVATPLWGGVPQQSCVQLGYYCLQLSAMAEQPQVPFGSLESGESDVRLVRRHNLLTLPTDVDGQPTWNNLIADLVAVIEHYRPEVLLTPHPELDPHHDHVASTCALLEACERSGWKPQTLLLYANHLHDNDRWPMGPAGKGVALPPVITPLPSNRLWSPTLAAEQQLDKAMALALQHDLQGPLPLKKRLRRTIQRLLAGRRWPACGEDEFFRKAVRRHELFWVRPINKEDQQK